MRRCNWLMGLVLLGVGWPGLVVGQDVDMEEVRRRAEKYEREAAKEAAKKAPAPVVDHDREAWQSAEKCGTAACFRAYLEDYPKGRYVRMAKARLEPEPKSRPAVNISRPSPAVRRTNQRFTDNSDGTVTDNQSGLVWLKNAN